MSVGCATVLSRLGSIKSAKHSTPRRPAVTPSWKLGLDVSLTLLARADETIESLRRMTASQPKGNGASAGAAKSCIRANSTD